MQNFGQINETFKEVLANAIVEGNNEQKKVFKVYTKELKENKTLRTQFEVFNKLENKVLATNESVDKTRMFVDECISILQGLDKKIVVESNERLVNYLNNKGFKLIEGYENEELHNHIHNLAFTDKTAKNVESIIESKLFVNQYSKPITETKESVETYINHFVGPVMVEKFNGKYLDKLSETEKKAFKVITNGTEEEKQELYKGTIRECVDLINDKLNDECTIQEKDKFLQVKDKLLRYSYSPESFVSEMSKIAYLKDSLI
jgi:hypothetical protein